MTKLEMMAFSAHHSGVSHSGLAGVRDIVRDLQAKATLTWRNDVVQGRKHYSMDLYVHITNPQQVVAIKVSSRGGVTYTSYSSKTIISKVEC